MKIKPLFLLAACSFASLSALADTYNLAGDTTFLSTFNRTIEDGSLLSDVGTAVHYYEFNFTVGLSGAYSLSALATDPANYDTFIHLYSNFNSAAPLTGFLAANDDGVNGNANLGSAINGFSLTAGNNYAFIINGYGNSDFGAFTASIVGPGAIAAVPEPSTYALMVGGAAGLFLARRRQAAKA